MLLFAARPRIGRYTFKIYTLPYRTRTHTVLRGPGPLEAQLMRIRWLPILRPEHLKPVLNAKCLGILTLPLPFQELDIEIYRHEPVVADIN